MPSGFHREGLGSHTPRLRKGCLLAACLPTCRRPCLVACRPLFRLDCPPHAPWLQASSPSKHPAEVKRLHALHRCACTPHCAALIVGSHALDSGALPGVLSPELTSCRTCPLAMLQLHDPRRRLHQRQWCAISTVPRAVAALTAGMPCLASVGLLVPLLHCARRVWF